MPIKQRHVSAEIGQEQAVSGSEVYANGTSGTKRREGRERAGRTRGPTRIMTRVTRRK
ncbi:hypothetical protein KI387_038072, partial [Taxus chinensis]